MAIHRPKTAKARATRAACGVQVPAAEPGLGTHCKSGCDGGQERRANRLALYAAKRKSAELVRDVDAKHGKRISHCGLVSFADRVTLHRLTAPDGAVRGTFSGLVTCSSVWCCPVCSRRISEARRAELNTLLAWARAKGHGVAMLTLTARHNAKTELGPFVADLKAALKALRQSSGWRRLGFVGTVAATEVTHGANGWHPHMHILCILPSAAGDPVAAIETMRARWLACLAAKGRDGNGAAFQVQAASAAGEYFAKFGAAEEMALNAAKLGRNGSRSPWQLLADARDGDRQAGRLFQEYAVAFKGKAQLQWSRGLKALAGIGEVSDDDCEPEGERVALRSWPGRSDYWRAARRRRCALLDAAELGDDIDRAEFGPTDAERWRRVQSETEVIEAEERR